MTWHDLTELAKSRQVPCHLPDVPPMPPSSSMSSRPVTRAKNADTHPGLRAQGEKQKRRGKAEVLAEKKKAAEEKLAKQEKKEQRLKKVAEIEEKLLDEDNDVTPRPT